MKKNMKHRVLAVLSAVLCVVAMTLSVAVLPAMAYANITRNPLFAAALAAVTENNKGKDSKEKGKSEGNRAANGEAGSESNGVASVNNGNAGEGAGSDAGNGAKSGNDAGDEKKQSNVPANVPERKSNKENGKQVDKNKKNNEAKNEDAKEKAKEKAKKANGQDRDAGTLEELTLEKVKALPACVGYRGSGFLSNAIIFRPDSGSGNACAISADGLPANFDSIRGAISKLNNDKNSSINFLGAKVYAYGSLSKNGVGLFSGKNIHYIDSTERFNVSNVTDMSYLFKDSPLTDFSFLSSWNVSKVTNMSNMFEGCAGLSDISSLSGWNTGSVTNMEGMFEGCTSLNDIDGLKDWDVSKVTNMSNMFSAVIADEDKRESFDLAGYTGLMNITSLEPLKNWKVSNVTNMDSMFEGCGSLEDFTGLENWKTKKVESMNSMFRYCMNIGKEDKSLNAFKKWDVSKVTGMRAMFAVTQIQNTVGIEDWNVSNVTAMDDMFAKCFKLNNINGLASWNTKGKSSTNRLTSTFRMFYGCNIISSIEPLKDWNVGNVTNMSGMFADCKKLTSAEKLSNWATKVGNVTNMSSLFSGCELLANISDLKDWNVGNVTDMNNMFSWCKSLSSLSDLKGWKVDNVTDMHSMFEECIGLTNLSGLQDWNVGNVTNMCNMFSHSLVEGADNLTDISALSGWNVSNVTDMSGMFSDCKKLTGAADLSGWDISKVTNLSSMFSNAGAESGDNFVLDFSNKTFTKSKTPVANADPDDQSKHYFSVDGMFDGFKGTLIANGWSSSGFGEDDGDNPIAKHFAKGGIFSLDENNHSDNIVITNNVTILDASSEDGTPLKKIAYYIPVKAKLMEPGDMPSCKCDDSSVPGGTAGDTTYTYYVPALYDSSNLERQQNEKSQDYAYRIVKNSFASKFRSAIDSQSGKEPGGDDTGDDTGDEVPGGNSRSARLKSRVKKLRSARESRSVKGDDDEVENPDEVPELPEEEQGNTYKIMFKKSSEGGCTWTELGNGDDNVPDNPKSPLIFFNTLYYLETFVKPVPLPHTGGQSAVMFTFLSIGLFSMFAVAGAFGRHGWVASVLSGTALTGFVEAFGGGALDIAAGFKHCFAHSVAHSVVSGSMLKPVVSAATGFFAWFRSNDSTFGKHTKQR